MNNQTSLLAAGMIALASTVVFAGGPANDDCANAVSITEGLTPFSNVGATTDGPNHAVCEAGSDSGVTANDIWYVFDATENGSLIVSTCEQENGSADYDTDIVVYRGANCGDLILQSCNDDDAMTLDEMSNSWTIATALTPVPFDFDFGSGAIAVDGDTAVVGAPFSDNAATGQAYIFQRNQGGADNWGQVTTIIGSQADSGFGEAIEISGDCIVASSFELEGFVFYTFDRNEGGADNRGEVARVVVGETGAFFAFDGDTLAIGQFVFDEKTMTSSIEIDIYAKDSEDSSMWSLVTTTIPSAQNNPGVNEYNLDLDGDTLVFSDGRDNSAGIDYGSVWIFERDEGGADNWGEVQKITAPDAPLLRSFGRSIAVANDAIVINSYQAGTGAPDASYLYRRMNMSPPWQLTGRNIPTGMNPDHSFAQNVVMGGDTVMYGAEELPSNHGSIIFYELIENPQAGDLNGDNCVDQQDLGILLASFNQDAGGDLDNDGMTGQSDLGILLANFNQGPGCG